MEKTGIIFNIEHSSFVDGPGIRTTVFFKGCNLRCVWCHNPEGQSFLPQMMVYREKCISCGKCLEKCPNGARDCTLCGKCARYCPADARRIKGKRYTVDDLLPKLLEDKDFYESSGGGVTLSGGECLMQADFCAELLRKLKENGINTAVDTCGLVSKNALDKVIPYTDVFLYDVKAIDEDTHIRCTGVSNKIILENLKYLDSLGCKIEIRYPFVPDYNDSEAEKIAEFLSKLKNVTKIRVLAYHNHAGSKYEALGMENTLPSRLPSDSEMKSVRETVQKISGFAVTG